MNGIENLSNTELERIVNRENDLSSISDAELERIANQPTQQPIQQKGFMGSILENLSRPGAAVRAPFFGQSPIEGFKQPKSIPLFGESFEKSYWDMVGKQSAGMDRVGGQVHPYLMIPGGMVTQASGMGLDVATDPMTYVYGAGAKMLMKTPVGAAIGRFLTKERHLPDITKPIRKYKKLGQELKALGRNYDDLPLSEIPRKLEEEAQLTKSQLQQHKIDFKDAVKTYSDKGAIEAKSKIAKFGENLTKTYDMRIDQVDDILSLSDEPINITKLDVSKDWLENSVNKLSGHPKEQLRLINSIKKLGYEAVGTLDETGDMVYNVMPKDPESMVNFRDLINYKNEIGALSGNASSATKHAFVEFLSDENRFPFNVSQVYKDMQTGYGPMANAKWEAYKIFKPFDTTNINTKQASAFFERVAQDTLKSGEQRLLNLIEEGSDFASGTGDISSTIKQFGLTSKTTEKQLTRQISDTLNEVKLSKDFLAKRQKMKDDAKRILKILGLGTAGEEVLRRTIFRR